MFIIIASLKLNNGDCPSLVKIKKLGITQEKVTKCRGSGVKSLHLVNDPNPSYAHDHMVL